MSRRLLIFAALVMTLVATPFLMERGTASGSTTVVVKPSGMNGWYFWNDKNDIFTGSPGELVTGPGTPPAGAGSVRLGPLTDNGATAAGHSVIATDAYAGTPLANFTTLAYSSYQPGPVQAIALQFDVQYRLADASYGGRLVFEPYQNGAVTVGAGWQSWSPLAGTWWATKTNTAGTGGAQVVALPAGNCAQGTPCTWSEINAAFPAARVLPTYGRFLLKAGSNWLGFDGNADSLTVGVSGSDTTYDFEAETACTATCYVDAATGNDSFGGDTPGTAKKTIQAAINAVSAGGTVNVAAGTYNEDVAANKANVQILGAGIDVSTIVGPIGGAGSTIQVTAGGVVVDGFTITRAGNNTTDWNGALNSAGVAVQSQGNTVELRYSKLTGNRTGIDINNSNGNSVHHNIIDNNRTGMIFRNQTDSTSVVNNFITNNWTIGVLFLDASGGTNVPVQSATGSTFGDNNISGNWYGQVEDRQSGASANLKNFEQNWWGTLVSAVSTAQATEPGYSAQIPVAFGGTATAPGGQPEIKGTGSANIDYVPYQCSGTDTSVAVGFQPSGVLCSPPTPVTTVVTASSMTATGWVFYNDETDVIDPTLGSFVTGPGTPALGTGSAQISVTGTQRRNLATYQFGGTPLADITQLRFRTYNPSAGNGGSASRSAFLHFNVDFNGSDTWQRRLVFVPSQNGTVLQNTWQEWDAISWGAGKWSYSGPTWPTTGQPGTTLKTWAQILSDYPGIRMRVTDSFAGLRVGEPYSDGYTENIDSFTFGTTSATTIFNFEDTPACTAVCYVNGTTGNDAFDGSTPTSAKKTIQGGINQVSVSGTVNVAAGTYNENVTIAKELTLAGASQATTIVRPAVSNPNPCAGSTLCGSGSAASNIILTQADNVTIHDMTLDGNNPLVTSGISAGGSDLDARNGIVENYYAGVFDNLTVHHVTVKNIFLRGIYASSGGSGFNFHHDTVENVQADPGSIGMFNWVGSGVFADNTVSYANDAIAANHSSGTQFLRNTVTNSGSGIHTDNAGDGGGVADLIQDNTISDSTYGIWVFVAYIAPTFDRNTVTNVDVGISSWGQGSPAPAATIFSNNTVDGTGKPGSVGVYVTTDQIGWGTNDTAVTLTGNIIKNNVDGIDVVTDAMRTATVQANRNQIFGNASGSSVTGAGTAVADLTGNWWGDASGPTHGLNPAGTGDAVSNGIVYSPWLEIGTDASVSAGFQMASPMTWIAGPAVCGATCIQAAIDAASAGDTVKAKTGTFNEHVNVNKQITLTAGSNPIVDGGGSGDAITISVPSVTVSSFEVQNAANGIVIAGGANNATVSSNNVHNVTNGIVIASGANSATVSGNNVHNFTAVGIQGTGATGAAINTNTVNGGHAASCVGGLWGVLLNNVSGTVNLNVVTGIGNGLLSGCQQGRAIEADGAGTVSITNNNVNTYQKSGIIVRDTMNSIITGNTTAGEGPTAAIAQNGITITSSGSAAISGNHTSGHFYTPATAASCGILYYPTGNPAAAALSVTGNDSTDDQVGICLTGGSATLPVSGMTATGNLVTKHHQQGILIDTMAAVVVSGNTIDGQGGGTSASAGSGPDTDTRYYGVFAVDSTGTIASNIIKGITHGVANGTQSGNGIRLTARPAKSSNMTINLNNITNVQKNAMTITNVYGGTSVSANVTNNVVAGNGPIAYIAQNGIQVSSGANATITGNNVSGYDYSPSSWAAVGVLVIDAGTVSVGTNNIHNNMEGMYIQQTDGVSVTGNQLTTTRDAAMFIYLSNGGTYTGNTVMGTPTSSGAYLYDLTTGNTFTGNAFRNNDTGVVVDYTGAGAPTGNVFNNGCFAGNTTAGMATLGTQVGGPVNAQSNWWGKVNGANPPGYGDAISPAATVNASLFLTAPVAGCPMPLDGDGDGLNDVSDNCPSVYNPDQVNTHGELILLPKPVPFYNDLTNPIQVNTGDACNNDLDHDGIANAAETLLGTSPYVSDTDGDRTNDGTEVACGSNPLSALSNLSGTDTDLDGLPNACETLYGTNPGNYDSDGDGSLDGAEVRYWTTNPLVKNTDGDNCTDGREIASINTDRTVNAIDLQQLALHFGVLTPEFRDFDMNGDGRVTASDLLFVAQRFGYCTPS